MACGSALSAGGGWTVHGRPSIASAAAVAAAPKSAIPASPEAGSEPPAGIARSKSAIVSQFEKSGMVMGFGAPPPGGVKALAAKRASVDQQQSATASASAAPAAAAVAAPELDEHGACGWWTLAKGCVGPRSSPSDRRPSIDAPSDRRPAQDDGAAPSDGLARVRAKAASADARNDRRRWRRPRSRRPAPVVPAAYERGWHPSGQFYHVLGRRNGLVVRIPRAPSPPSGRGPSEGGSPHAADGPTCTAASAS